MNAMLQERQKRFGWDSEPMTIVDDTSACSGCNGYGWIRYDVPLGHGWFGKMFPCPDCERGQAIEIQRYTNLLTYAELPASYQQFSFMTWEQYLTDAQRDGKHAAYMAAVRFCQNERHFVNLAEIYDILGMTWERDRVTRVKNSLVFYGEYGTGKTGLCAAIVNELLLQGKRSLYIRCRDMLREIQSRYRKDVEPSADDMLRKFQRAPILFIDEFNIGNLSDDRMEIIEDVMRYRYGNQLPTIMTCNINQQMFYNQWGGRTGDVVIAMAHWIEVGGVRLRTNDAPVIEQRSAAREAKETT